MLAASWAGYTWSLSHTVSSKSIHWVEAPLESRSNVTSKPKIWSSHQPHWLLQSSGTTGEPKLISLTWDQIEANARGAEERFKLTPRDRWLCVLPLGHVAGASIVARSCVIGFSVCLDEFNAERFKTFMTRVFNTKAQMLVQILSEKSEKNDQTDLYAWFMRLTMNAFCEIAFGIDVGGMTGELQPFAVSFDFAQNQVTRRTSVLPPPVWKTMRFFSIGSEGRMNVPGRSSGNWAWRMKDGEFTDALVERLRGLNEVYGRLVVPEQAAGADAPEAAEEAAPGPEAGAS